MASNGVPGCRLNPLCKAISPATGIPMIHAVLTKPGSKVMFKNELMLAYGTACLENDLYQRYHSGTTHKRKFRVQWIIGEKLLTSEHGAMFFKDQQPVSLEIPPPTLPNVATQDA